jgi:membrane protease YdiL (CAAX protease family)
LGQLRGSDLFRPPKRGIYRALIWPVIGVDESRLRLIDRLGARCHVRVVTSSGPAQTTWRSAGHVGLVTVAVVAWSVLIVLVGNAYYAFLNPRFPHVGESAGLALLWGVLSRAHLILLGLLFVLWRPRQLGFQIGETRRHWKLLLVMLLANCGVVAAFLRLSGSGTPYSGDQWLATEVITVPVVEETIWRGLVFAAVLFALERKSLHSDNRRNYHLAVWLSGLSFGLVHASNVLAGVPFQFVAVQTLKCDGVGCGLRLCAGEDRERLPTNGSAFGDEPGCGVGVKGSGPSAQGGSSED